MSVSNRIDTDIAFMMTAALMAQRSTCLRGKVGAVIVKDRRIISVGYNGPPSGQPHCIDVGCQVNPDTGGCLRSIHAEANAILWAARQGLSVNGGILYTTHLPCRQCSIMAHGAGIVETRYTFEYRNSDGKEFILAEQLEFTSWNHPYLGYLGTRCLLCDQELMMHT